MVSVKPEPSEVLSNLERLNLTELGRKRNSTGQEVQPLPESHYRLSFSDSATRGSRFDYFYHRSRLALPTEAVVYPALWSAFIKLVLPQRLHCFSFRTVPAGFPNTITDFSLKKTSTDLTPFTASNADDTRPGQAAAQLIPTFSISTWQCGADTALIITANVIPSILTSMFTVLLSQNEAFAPCFQGFIVIYPALKFPHSKE